MSRVWISPILAFTLIAGCGFANFTRISVNTPITSDDAAFIRPGQTTFEELVARLGTPEELLESDEGAIAVFHFLDAKHSRINYGMVASVWSPVIPDLITEGLGIGFDRFEVHLNRVWLVHHIEFTRQPGHPPAFNLWPFMQKRLVEEPPSSPLIHSMVRGE